MAFRIRSNELIAQLQRAKEQEMAAIERLKAYMLSPNLHESWLKKLTDDMAASCELSARLWRELHDVVPDPEV